jgi:hypothetical protein
VKIKRIPPIRKLFKQFLNSLLSFRTGFFHTAQLDDPKSFLSKFSFEILAGKPMEFLRQNLPPAKKSILKHRQTDERPWDGDEDVAGDGNPEADLFEQVTIL